MCNRKCQFYLLECTMVSMNDCPYNKGEGGMSMESEKKTKWIWTDDWSIADTFQPKLVRFRKEIELYGEIESVIDISADSRYKLFINEKLVEVGPSKGDDKIWYVDSLNISDFLIEGKNVISIIVLRYPLDHSKGNHSIFRTKTPGLYYSGWIKDNSGIKEINADEEWYSLIDDDYEIVSESEEFAPMQIYEKVSGNEILKNWLQPDYSTTGWSKVRVYSTDEMDRAISPGNLTKRTIPYLYRIERNFSSIVTLRQSMISLENWSELIRGKNTITIPPNTKEIVEISAGEEMTGYLKLEMTKGKNTKIKILQSEAYVQKETTQVNGLTIHVKKDREDFENGYLDGFTDEYLVAGYGEEDSPELYEPFWFRTFRYIRLEIETSDEELKLHGFNYCETGYPLEVKTKVKCSDDSLSSIWDISERTLKRCMHETYEDCPFYEQLQYLMDSRSQILYTYAVSADDRLARKCMDDFKRSQRYDGTLNASYPCYGPNVIPGFSIYYILMVYDHMMYFDDRELVEYHFPTIQNILNYFENNLEPEGYVGKLGGLNGKDRYWSFIDWTTEWNNTTGVPNATLDGPITMESLLYILGLQTAQNIAQYLHLDQLGKIYEDRAKKVQKSVQNNCIGSNNMIQDGPGIEAYSQHGQVFAALTDTISHNQSKKNLRETIVNKEKYAQCSVAMSFYLFRALQKLELYDLTDDYWNIWRRMIANNATTCVEAEAGERSECHAWGSLALYELPSVVLGVTPAEPGFKKINISPVPGYLEWAEGNVITPVGEIKVSWKKKGEDITLDYVVPEGVRVQLNKKDPQYTH